MQPTSELMRTAREMRAAGDVDDAVRIYEEILQGEPDHPGALHSLGVLMNQRQDSARAADLLERALVLCPSVPFLHVDLGESYRNLGDYRKAIACCGVALRLQPEFPEALNTLGLALVGTGDLAGALNQFCRAIEAQPEFSPAQTNAGRVLQDLGSLEDAVICFRNAVELEPDSALTRTNLGLALLARGHVSEALDHFQRAVSIRPDLAVVHHNVGNALRILERRAEARASYLEAIERDPGLALTYFHIGLTFRAEGSLQDAVDWYGRAIDREPDNAEFREELAGLLRGSDELEDAVQRRSSPTPPSVDARVDERIPSGVELPQDGWRGNDRERRLAEQATETGSAPIQFATGASYVGAGLALEERGRSRGGFRELRPDAIDESDPALACTARGMKLIESGQAAEALPHFEEAVRLRPELAAVHHNLGNVLRMLERSAEARRSYLAAIRLDPGFIPSYLHVGMTLLFEEALDDALIWYRTAVEMEPDNPNLWGELAELHLTRDESAEAVDCRRRVIELRPADQVGALLALGWAMQEDERPDEALEQFQIAHRIKPDSPLVYLSLSGLYEEQGDMSEAESAVREAIRLRPSFPAAYARLAALVRDRLSEDELRTIEALLADTQLDRQPRARLLFGLAHVLDGRGEYARAAAYLKEANVLARELKRAEGVVYHAGNTELFVTRLIEAFDEEFCRRTAGLGLTTRRPVFVVGLPRSGTTLVEQILASHPRVFGAGERFFARQAFESLPAVVGRNRPPIGCVGLLDEYALRRLAGEHLAQLNALDLGRFDRIVDKLPDNYHYLGLLMAMFPNAAFIHCRRDLRDVAVSCWITDFRSIRWANDWEDIASRFQHYLRFMRHWERVLPAGVVEVRYEDTVSDLEAVARRLIDACGLEWDPSCLDFHRTKRPVRTASYTQVRQPIYARSVARWKHYENELAELFAAIDRQCADLA